MHVPADSRRRRKVLHFITIPAIVACALLILGKRIAFPRILQEVFRLHQNDDGSLPLVTQHWADYPADIMYNFYLWNLTNPYEVIYEGAMPRFQDYGPYAYLGGERKENLTWSSDGNVVSYRTRRYWVFDEKASCSTCREDDLFIVPNVAYAAVAYIAAHTDLHPLLLMLLDQSMLMVGSAPVQTVEAGALIFRSFQDPLISLQTSTFVKNLVKLMGGTLFGIKLPDYPHPGLMPLYNNTYDPEYRVHTGKTGMDDYTKIITYGGKTQQDWFLGDSAEITNCNDGGFNKQFLTPKDKLNVFRAYLGRSFEMSFHESSSHNSVPTYVFRIDRNEYNSNSPRRIGMRYENVEGVMHVPADSRRRRKVLHFITIPAIVACALLILGKRIAFPRILQEVFRLHQNDDGSLPLVTQHWADYPADIMYNFYLWNLTNPYEVIYEGAMPRFQDYGPYAYLGGERKENLTWSSDGNVVSYRTRRYWVFDEKASCSTCREDDLFIVPNVAYAAVAYIAAHTDLHPLLLMLLDQSMLMVGSAPVQTVEAGALIFRSFQDPLISLQTSTFVKNLVKLMGGTLFGIKLPDYPHPGLMPLYNNTYDPEYRVHTGKTGMDDYTKIITYGGKTQQDWFLGDSAEITNCNDGGFNKQFLTPKDKLNVFRAYLGRSFEMSFHESSSHNSVPTYVFRIDRNEYNSNSPRRIGMRYENVEGVMHVPADSRRRRKVLHFITIPAIVACALLILGKRIAFPRILQEVFRLHQNDDGSLPLVTQHWADYPADIMYNFYLWNLTNPYEVIYEGAMPRFQDYGPYAYLGGERKENLTWSSDGNVVSYRTRRYWVFDEKASCSTCREDDLFIVPNVAYAAVAYIAAHTDLHPLLLMLLDQSMLMVGSAPVQTVEAGALIFRSFQDPLISLQTSTFVKNLVKLMGGTLFGIKLPDYPHPGLMPLYNNTYDPEYRVHTGKTGMDDYTKIITYGGKTQQDWFLGDSAEITNCNDGGFNKQFLTPKDKLNVFRAYLGRSFEMSFHESSSHNSVPTYVFRIDRNEYNSNSPRRIGMRYENVEGVDYAPTWPVCPSEHVYSPDEDGCAQIECTKEINFCDNCCNGSHYGPTVFTPPGFYPLKVFPGRLGRIPFGVLMSPPHMLWAPEQVSSQYVGQYPDEVKHQPVEWSVNPTMGTVVHAHLRTQMNILFARRDMTQSTELPNSMAPIFWLHIEVLIHDEVMFIYKLGGLYVPFFLDFALYFHLLVIFISLSVVALDKLTRLEKLPVKWRSGRVGNSSRTVRIYTIETA